ncbi:DNA/RNA non-specific endonuclease [Streptomyces sp. CRN 30]|uniref:DNA/RNA non-specific endonuclease n=1 Tax=Streptomyces sp. CRN 30 TaxID=3075613 RepID=UPI002A81E311|nr:DNA/RNA non-specific endonuclease [Streptomyces sp. CRN 30]
MWRRALSGVTVAGTVAALALTATAPTAAAKEKADGDLTTGMTEGRVTKLVTDTPDSAGNLKVELSNGMVVAIPAAQKDLVMDRAAEQADEVHTEGTVYGNCGSSYIELEQKSNRHPLAVRTGFKLNQPAVGYAWFATVVGTDYLHEYTDSGVLLLDSSWDGGYESDEDEAEGIYTAVVDPGVSSAVLWNGGVCYSGGPTDAEYLTEPKADCLEDVPAGAVTSGGGWIRNTTVTVAQRNKTTNPPGLPGDRPYLAQACLSTPLGTGSGAAGDITGWQDARIFVAANAPGTAIARCHLIANILGGKGRILDGGQANLVPCWQVGMNTGTPSMRTYEAQVQAAVTATTMGPNDAVFYEVTPNYRNGTSTIPWGVTMSATIQRADGTTQPLFSGIVITNTQAASGLNLGN